MFGYILSPHVNATDVGDPGFSWPTGFNQIVGGQHYSLNGAIELSLGVFNGCGHESTRALGKICSPGPEIMNTLDLKHAVINIQTQRLISKVMAWGMLSFIPYTNLRAQKSLAGWGAIELCVYWKTSAWESNLSIDLHLIRSSSQMCLLIVINTYD